MSIPAVGRVPGEAVVLVGPLHACHGTLERRVDGVKQLTRPHRLLGDLAGLGDDGEAHGLCVVGCRGETQKCLSNTGPLERADDVGADDIDRGDAVAQANPGDRHLVCQHLDQ